MTLKDAFSALFGIACAKDAIVTTHLGLCGGSNRENVSFTIVAHDKKVDIFVFFRMLYLIRVRQVGEDKLWWVPSIPIEECSM
jgi:hypothetical protein